MDRKELLEDEYEPQNWWSNIREKFFGHDEDEDEMENDASSPRQAPSRGHVLRLDATRPNAIYVRLDFRTMQDAQSAADRLKERRPVIVNFERSDEDVARRGVDFISGVTYALDGFYQKVGDKVFLFTPSNTSIALEEEDARAETYDRR